MASKSVTLDILARNSDAIAKIDQIKGDYAKLKAEVDAGNLDLSPKQLSGAYNSQLRMAARELFNVGSEAEVSRGKVSRMSNVIQDMTSKIPVIGGIADSFGKMAGNLFGMVGQGGGDLEEAAKGIGSIAGSGVGLAAVAAAVGGIAIAADALGTAFFAAGTGLGAFAILAIPTLKKVFGAVSDTRKQLEKLPTPIRDAVDAIRGIKGQFDDMSKAVQPYALKLLTQGLGIVTQHMGALKGFVKPVFDGLSQGMAIFNRELSTPFMAQFVHRMQQMSGPVIKAVLSGISGLIPDVARLFNIMSQKDVINSINIAFRVMGGTLSLLSGIVRFAMDQWDQLIQGVRNAAHFFSTAGADIGRAARGIGNAFSTAERVVGGAFNSMRAAAGNSIGSVLRLTGSLGHGIINAVGNAGSWLRNAGVQMVEGFISGVESDLGRLLGYVSNIGSFISGTFKNILGIHSPSRVFEEHGKSIVQGLALGISGNSSLAENAVRGLAQSSINASPHGRILGAAGANIKIDLDWGPHSDQDIISAFKKAIRVRGGNPALLGR